MTDTLKPCPFCGNAAAHLWREHGAVQCLSCNAKAVDVVGWNMRPALPADEVRRIAEKWTARWADIEPGAVSVLDAIKSAINEALGNVAAGREGV